MVATRSWRRFSLVMVALLGLVLALGSVMTAGAGGKGGSSKIRACVDRETGDVRIVSSRDDCREGERYMEWNKQGHSGGLSGVEVVFDVWFSNVGYVLCPEGKVATGGGALAVDEEDFEFDDAALSSTWPLPSVLLGGESGPEWLPIGWVASYHAELEIDAMVVFAVCADHEGWWDSKSAAMAGQSLPFELPKKLME